MDTKVFAYFAAVEKHRNFSRAAQELYLSPQGLNAAMKRLEGELGVSLFEVRRGAVELTEHGECFSRHISLVNEQLACMREELNAISARDSNSIRLGCALGVLGYLGEGVIASFNEQHDDVRVVVEEELPDYSCERNMAEGKYDFALITNPVECLGFATDSLCEDYQFCWVNRDDELASHDELTLADLAGRTIVTVGEGYKGTSRFLELCSQFGVFPRVVYASEMMGVYESVRTGKAVGLSCRNHVERAPSSSVVGLPLKCLSWGFSICYRRDRVLSYSDHLFLAYMRECRRTYV